MKQTIRDIHPKGPSKNEDIIRFTDFSIISSKLDLSSCNFGNSDSEHWTKKKIEVKDVNFHLQRAGCRKVVI